MDEITALFEAIRLSRHIPPPLARVIRVQAGLSQADLARALGVSRASVSRWEAGTSKARPTVRLAWLRALDALQRGAAL